MRDFLPFYRVKITRYIVMITKLPITLICIITLHYRNAMDDNNINCIKHNSLDTFYLYCWWRYIKFGTFYKYFCVSDKIFIAIIILLVTITICIHSVAEMFLFKVAGTSEMTMGRNHMALQESLGGWFEFPYLASYYISWFHMGPCMK